MALLIDALSDNRNRTGSEIRSLLTKNGGSLAEPGAVSWQFERKGIVQVARTADEDEVMMVGLENGAEDLADHGEAWQVTSEPTDVLSLRAALEEAGIEVTESDTTMMPTNTVPMTEPGQIKAVLSLIELLDDHEDVQDVYSNIDIPDDVLESID